MRRGKIFSMIELFLIPLLLSPVDAHAFSDVPKTHVFEQGISYVESEGIVSGYGDGTFKPDATINRAEFTKIIVETAIKSGLMKNVAADSMVVDAMLSGFSDTEKDAWYGPYVANAKAQGIIKGYDDGTFRPGAAVNMAEAAKIVSQALKLPAFKESKKENWFDEHMDALRKAGAIPSTNPEPGKQISRGEMADIIYRISDGNGSWSLLTATDADFSVWYPQEEFDVTSSGNTLRVVHSHDKIYDNPCDTAGEAVTKLERFVDADLTFTFRNKSLEETVLELDDPFIADQYLENGKFKPLEGFIEPVSIAGFNGHIIRATVDGCGTDTYYFEISDSATLKVDRVAVPEFVILHDALRIEFAFMEGAVLPTREQRILEDMLRTFSVKTAQETSEQN